MSQLNRYIKRWDNFMFKVLEDVKLFGDDLVSINDKEEEVVRFEELRK